MAPTLRTRKLPVIISTSALNTTLSWRELVEDVIATSGDSRVRGLSPALVLALIYTESRGKASAVSPEESSYGLMQVNYEMHYASTGRPKSELFNPRINVIEGTKILAGMIASLGGDVDAAVSAYNGGGGRRHPAGTRFCLMWNKDAPKTNRNLDRDCAVMYVTTFNGEFGNQPYVDEVTEAQRQIFQRIGSGVPRPPSTPTPPTTGSAGGAAVAVIGGGLAVTALLKLLGVIR